MKKYLIISFLFLSSLITAQTIVTNVVTGLHPKVMDGILFRADTFYIKNNFILWNSDNSSVLYYIASYNKISDNVYTIYCSTNGKVVIFTVDFNKEYIILNNDILFSKSMKL